LSIGHQNTLFTHIAQLLGRLPVVSFRHFMAAKSASNVLEIVKR